MSQITNLLKNFKLTISTVAENIVRKQVLRKQSLQELFESRITFVESSPKPGDLVKSSTKAGWLLLKDLQKQNGFRWKLYESKIAFVESSKKEGWLSLKALQKQDNLLTGVATTMDTKAPPISQAYLVTYINVFLLFSIGLMFYKVLCCMFTYL